jgi:hypothetical protein
VVAGPAKEIDFCDHGKGDQREANHGNGETGKPFRKGHVVHLSEFEPGFSLKDVAVTARWFPSWTVDFAVYSISVMVNVNRDPACVNSFHKTTILTARCHDVLNSVSICKFS